MAKTVESEIIAACNVSKRAKNEEEQVYLERLAEAVRVAPDKQWEELSDVAANWSNAALAAHDAGKPIPSLPTDAVETKAKDKADKKADKKAAAEAKVEAKVETKTEPVESEKAAAKGKPGKGKGKAAKSTPAPEPAPAEKRAPRAAKATKAKTEPVAPAEKAPARAAKSRSTGNGKGVYASTQEYIVMHPNATTDEIMTALRKSGLDPRQNTVQSVRGHTRDTMKLVQKRRKVELGIV